MNRTLLVYLQSAVQSKKMQKHTISGCRASTECMPRPASQGSTAVTSEVELHHFLVWAQGDKTCECVKNVCLSCSTDLFARVRKSEKISYLYYCQKKKKSRLCKKSKAFLNQTTHCAKVSGIRAAQRKRGRDVEAPLTHSVGGFLFFPKEQHVERPSAPPSPSSLHRLETPPIPLASPSAPALWI